MTPCRLIPKIAAKKSRCRDNDKPQQQKNAVGVGGIPASVIITRASRQEGGRLESASGTIFLMLSVSGKSLSTPLLKILQTGILPFAACANLSGGSLAQATPYAPHRPADSSLPLSTPTALPPQLPGLSLSNAAAAFSHHEKSRNCFIAPTVTRKVATRRAQPSSFQHFGKSSAACKNPLKNSRGDYVASRSLHSAEAHALFSLQSSSWRFAFCGLPIFIT